MNFPFDPRIVLISHRIPHGVPRIMPSYPPAPSESLGSTPMLKNDSAMTFMTKPNGSRDLTPAGLVPAGPATAKPGPGLRAAPVQEKAGWTTFSTSKKDEDKKGKGRAVIEEVAKLEKPSPAPEPVIGDANGAIDKKDMDKKDMEEKAKGIAEEPFQAEEPFLGPNQGGEDAFMRLFNSAVGPLPPRKESRYRKLFGKE